MKENMRRFNTGKKKPLLRSDGKRYESLTQAARENEITLGTLSEALKLGTRANGFKWQYA